MGQLAGRKIGLNGVNSIGTLLVAALLSSHGISPKTVKAIANGDASTVQAIMARDDQLPAEVTASMALPRHPVGPVVEAEIQRVARAMGQAGLLGRDGATEAGQRTLVEAMTSPAS